MKQYVLLALMALGLLSVASPAWAQNCSWDCWQGSQNNRYTYSTPSSTTTSVAVIDTQETTAHSNSTPYFSFTGNAYESRTSTLDYEAGPNTVPTPTPTPTPTPRLAVLAKQVVIPGQVYAANASSSVSTTTNNGVSTTVINPNSTDSNPIIIEAKPNGIQTRQDGKPIVITTQDDSLPKAGVEPAFAGLAIAALGSLVFIIRSMVRKKQQLYSSLLR
jgi:hypothetical protein